MAPFAEVFLLEKAGLFGYIEKEPRKEKKDDYRFEIACPMGPGRNDPPSWVLRIEICDRRDIFDLSRLEFPEKGEQDVKTEGDETAWVKRMRQKVEVEMAKKEIEALLYWKGEVEKILGRRPESLGTFQLEIQNLIQRMQNRIRVLKNSLQE